MCWCAAPAVTPYALEPLAARNSDLVLMVDLPALCNHPQVRRAFETHSAPDGNSKWKKLCDRVRNAGFQWEDFLGRYLFYANTVTETGGMVLETVDGGAMRLFEVAQRNSSMRSNVQSSLIAGQKLLVVRGGYFRPDSALLLEGKNLLMVMVGITPVPQTKSREVPPLLEGRAMGGNLVRMLVLPRGLFSVMEMQGGCFPAGISGSGNVRSAFVGPGGEVGAADLCGFFRFGERGDGFQASGGVDCGRSRFF